MKVKYYYKDNTTWEGNLGERPHTSKIIHREDGPAVEHADGAKVWFLNGKLHRKDGPAVERWEGKQWYLNGQRHRKDGPAIEWTNGWKEWWLNGKFHREDGPARMWSDGTAEWYLNGQLHREDGPAVEWENGYKEWYLNSEELKTLSQEYLIRYMELTGETLAMLLLHPEEIVRDSVKKYKWS